MLRVKFSYFFLSIFPVPPPPKNDNNETTMGPEITLAIKSSNIIKVKNQNRPKYSGI
jgi:hypothetical protein